MLGTIQKWGNSQAIRLPKVILETAMFSENEPVQIIAEKDQIIIKKAAPQKTLEELLEDYSGEYNFEEFDWGPPVGNKVL
ncbi:hypothetical protein SDC9_114498 [bioreactor metagenome]|uniref:SpoVT-AbrB domain-containing protein n=1 Tax=bioreactor metagenome TaxID=1076179 RepID=A0A645BQK5_9ZZZZ